EFVARQARYVAEIRVAAQLLGAGHDREAAAVLDRQAPGPGQTDPREFAWGHLRTLPHREQATLGEHRGEVYGVASARDAPTLASGGRDRSARLWDGATRRTRAVLRGHTNEVNGVAFSPDGGTLATASDDRSIRLWGVADGHELGVLGRHED